MELKDIKDLIKTINDSELAYFEMKFEENYLKMDKSLVRGTSENNSDCTKLSNEIKTGSSISNSKVNEVKSDNKDKEPVAIVAENTKDENYEFINCPMVGTYYGSSAPGKDPFISKGDIIKKGSVLCIVEAMKLMNEIEADFDMEIIDILVKDGDMVEYGKPILKVRRG